MVILWQSPCATEIISGRGKAGFGFPEQSAVFMDPTQAKFQYRLSKSLEGESTAEVAVCALIGRSRVGIACVIGIRTLAESRAVKNWIMVMRMVGLMIFRRPSCRVQTEDQLVGHLVIFLIIYCFLTQSFGHAVDIVVYVDNIM